MSDHQIRTIIKRRQLELMTGKSYPTLHRMMKAGAFPLPVKLGPNSVGWFLDEVQAWQESLERGHAVAPNLTKGDAA